MTTVIDNSGTETLKKLINKSIEERLKPEGMTSKLFWEIYNFLSEEEVSYSGTY